MKNNFAFKVPNKKIIITCNKLKNGNWKVNAQSQRHPKEKTQLSKSCTPDELSMFVQMVMIKSERLPEENIEKQKKPKQIYTKKNKTSQ